MSNNPKKTVLKKIKLKPIAKPKHETVKPFDVNVHKQTKSEFKCVICEKSFQEHNQLITHFRMHGRNEIDLRGRPIIEASRSSVMFALKMPADGPIEFIDCEWCSETFPNISKAIEHKFRKHRYESANYFCKYCGKLFPLKIGRPADPNPVLRPKPLDQHTTTTHKREQSLETLSSAAAVSQFSCDTCSAQFTSNTALKCHEKTAHQTDFMFWDNTHVPPASKKIRIEKDQIISLFYCHLCGNEYMLKYNLKKHLIDHHTEAEKNTISETGIIKCKACEAIFYNARAYSTHNIHHKADDLYVVSEEQRQKIVTRVDQDFDIRRVPFPKPETMRANAIFCNTVGLLSAPSDPIETNFIKSEDTESS